MMAMAVSATKKKRTHGHNAGKQRWRAMAMRLRGWSPVSCRSACGMLRTSSPRTPGRFDATYTALHISQCSSLAWLVRVCVCKPSKQAAANIQDRNCQAMCVPSAKKVAPLGR